MMAKIVQTAKQTVNAIVESQSARACPSWAVVSSAMIVLAAGECLAAETTSMRQLMIRVDVSQSPGSLTYERVKRSEYLPLQTLEMTFAISSLDFYQAYDVFALYAAICALSIPIAFANCRSSAK